MDYVLLRYRERPGVILDTASTADVQEAVALSRRWCHAAPDEGLIVTIGDQPFLHCPPRAEQLA